MSSLPLQGCKLLIVEDDALNAQLLTFQLEDEGIEFIGPAASVAAAIDLHNRHSPDLVLLDYRVQGGTVEPVMEMLVAKGTPFVLATGAVPDQFNSRFPQVQVLIKPFTAKDLIAALRKAYASKG